MITPPDIKDRETVLAKWQAVIDKTFDIFSWTSHHELSWLAECASQASRIVEVGSYHGKSTKVIALAASPKIPIHVADIPQDRRCEMIRDINLKEFTDRASILMHSTGVHILDLENYVTSPDFCFIDGGHLEADVKSDIEYLRSHMPPGAIMSGHDWRPHDMNDGVNQAVLKTLGMPSVFESIWWVRLT